MAAARPVTSSRDPPDRAGVGRVEATVPHRSQAGQRPNQRGAEWSHEVQVKRVEVFMGPS